MLIDSIKKQVQEESSRISATNPLIVAAREGKLDKTQVTKYLFNLMYFFHHTPIHLKRAKNKAAERGMTKLAEFFDEKIREESGHEYWAKDDIEGLGGKAPKVDLHQVNAGTLRLLAHAKEVIDENPALFIPYMLFMEYFTVLAAPEFLENLQERCGIPRNFMTAIAKHEELDKDHVVDDFEVLAWSSEGVDPDRLIDAMNGTMRFTEEMLAECVTNPN